MKDELLNRMALAANVETGSRTEDQIVEIEEPTCERTPAGHLLFSYGYPDNIQIVVEHLHQRNRELWGELTVLWAKDHDSRRRVLLNRKRVNFRSTSHSDTISRFLQRRLDRDWRSRLEHLASVCESQNISGEPAEWLGEKPLPGPTTWLIDGLLEADQHTLIYGDGDSGKSLFALGLALTVAGAEVLPGMRPGRVGRVLYLDWETNAEAHARRMYALCTGAGVTVPAQGIRYKRMFSPLADAIEEVRAEVNEYGIDGRPIDLIINDSASIASGGLISDESAVAQYYLAMRSLTQTTALSICHISKANVSGDSSRPIGSAYWYNQSRAAFELVNDQTEGDGYFSMVLNHRKNNNTARLKARAFKVSFADDSIRFSTTDPAANPTLNITLSLRRRVEFFLLNNPWATAKDIAEGIEAAPRKVNDCLLNGQRSGLFLRSGAKRPFIWSVAENDRTNSPSEFPRIQHGNSAPIPDGNSDKNSAQKSNSDSGVVPPKGELYTHGNSDKKSNNPETVKDRNSGTPIPTTTTTNINPEELPW